MGVAAVIPGPVPAAWMEGQAGGDRKGVELAGMKFAMGFDEEARYVELKGPMTTGDVTLYWIDWEMANRIRESISSMRATTLSTNRSCASSRIRLARESSRRKWWSTGSLRPC